MILKIKHNDLKGYIGLLFNLKLRGKQSRMRVRFLKLLQERYRIVLQEIEELQKEYAEKKDGEIVFKKTKMPDGSETETFKIEDIPAYHKELKVLMDELFIIEVNQEKIDMILSVKDSVLNCDLELSGEDAIIYDSLCELFESLEN